MRLYLQHFNYYRSMLHKQYLAFEDFSLLILDEVHHAAQEHVYARLLRMMNEKVKEPKFQPKVLGLTASPAGELDVWRTLVKVVTILKNTQAKLATPVVEREELEQVVVRPDMSIRPVPIEKREQELKKLITSFADEVLQTLPGKPSGFDPMAPNFENAIKSLDIEKPKRDILLQTSNVIDEMFAVGYVSAMEDLDALLDLEGVKQYSTHSELVKIQQSAPTGDTNEHSKANYLIMELLDAFADDSKFKGLVFVQTRRTCRCVFFHSACS